MKEGKFTFMKMLFLFFFSLTALAQDYPREWFLEIPREEASSWEILPQDALPGEVILSKRNELGIFSNFAATPFELEGKIFASVEGFWQSLKYPDPELQSDERFTLTGWPFKRHEVEAMISFDAKRAGDAANKIYRENGIRLVSWGTHLFDYVDRAEGSAFHYILIKRVLRAKLDQNPGLWELLMKTGCLILKPDHKISETAPASFHYGKIFMELRSEKLFVPCPSGT